MWPFDNPKRKEYEAKLLAEAQKLLGVRFLQNGRVPSQGLDCLGLVVYLQRAAGVSDFPDADRNYPSDWHLHESQELYLKAIQQHGKPIDIPDLRIGDVICFRLGVIFPGSGSLRIQHAGIVVEPKDRRFVHCLGGRGVTFSTLKERAWSMCYSAGARPLAVMAYLGES
jgi:cell wall-associated NlpC family hydrolase